jgi:hypothetical protein
MPSSRTSTLTVRLATATVTVALLGVVERCGEQRLDALPLLVQRSLRALQGDDRMN